MEYLKKIRRWSFTLTIVGVSVLAVMLYCIFYWWVVLEFDDYFLSFLKEDMTMFFKIPFQVFFHSSISPQLPYGGANLYY